MYYPSLRRHVDLAHFHDEVGGIEALVAAERDRVIGLPWLKLRTGAACQ